MAVALLVLGGCASRPLPPVTTIPPAPAPAPAPAAAPSRSTPGLAHYRCDDGVAFTVRFEDDSAVIDAGSRGSETLDRDAGGLTASQTVYSSTTMKAQFGLGADAREAQLNYASPPRVARCARD